MLPSSSSSISIPCFTAMLVIQDFACGKKGYLASVTSSVRSGIVIGVGTNDNSKRRHLNPLIHVGHRCGRCDEASES